MPSKEKLAKRYDVNVGTLDKALQELVSEGFVEKRRGSGTYVLKQNKVSTQTLGVYFRMDRHGDPRVKEFGGELYERVIAGIQAAGYGCRHYVDIRPEALISEPFPQLLEDIAEGKIAGLVLVQFDIHHDAWLNSLSLPIVSFDRDFGWGSVSVDYRQCGVDAANLLVKLGCQKIELLSVHDKEWEMTSDAIGLMRPLRAGITNVLLQNGLRAPEVWLTPDHYPASIRDLHYSYDDERKGYELCKVLFQLVKPDGIVIFTDIMAMGAARALAEMGFTLGKDIHGVVLGNCELNFPGLEHYIRFDLSITELAETLINMMSAALAGAPPQTVYLKRKLNKGSLNE